jgi:hypothetical protein
MINTHVIDAQKREMAMLSRSKKSVVSVVFLLLRDLIACLDFFRYLIFWGFGSNENLQGSRGMGGRGRLARMARLRLLVN